jgi:uncharacterized membrane protein
MTTVQPARAKEPRSVLAGPYGHPFHPVMVTVPIGAWISSVVLDVVALAGDNTALAEASLWLIGIGIVGALVAAVLGLLDLSTIPRGTKAFRTGVTHMGLNLVAVAPVRGRLRDPVRTRHRVGADQRVRSLGGRHRHPRRVGLARREAGLPLRRPGRRRTDPGRRVQLTHITLCAGGRPAACGPDAGRVLAAVSARTDYGRTVRPLASLVGKRTMISMGTA